MNLDELLTSAPPRPDLLVHDGRRLSTTDVLSRAARLASALNARGIGHGDHVAFQLPVGVDAIVVYRGCWSIGVVPVALHPLAGAAQLGQALD